MRFKQSLELVDRCCRLDLIRKFVPQEGSSGAKSPVTIKHSVSFSRRAKKVLGWWTERTSWFVWADEVLYVCWCKIMQDLKVSNIILYSIRYSTGSQCNASRTGVMWSRYFVRETNLAAEFWIRCNLAISHFGRPKSRLSSRDDTNACTRRSVAFESRYLHICPIL